MIQTTLIDAVRKLYIEEFRRIISEKSDFHLEPALRTSDGALALDGDLQLPYRPDLLPKAGGDSIMVDSPAFASFDPWEVQMGAVEMWVAPFIWDQMEVSLIGADENWGPVQRWFYQWFDPEDRNSLNPEGFYGVVHYMSDPEVVGDRATLVIDLGTAPIEAFTALLHALVAMRPARIEIT